MIVTLLTTALLLAILFGLTWIFAERAGNHSWVDAVWAISIGLTSVVWLVIGEGDPVKRIIAGLLVGIWSVRLAWHLQGRIRRMHPQEDIRYVHMKQRWGKQASGWFFGFFQIQAVSAWVMALPFLMIARDVDGVGSWEILGALVALGSIIGELLADHQLATFKKSQPTPQQVCQKGLWRYSRHPNYFFEALLWLGFWLFACGSSGGWMTVHAPLLILFLLLKVTGVPPSEEASLRSKGDAYRAYQRTTSAFVPLPPRSQSKS